jgi:DNA replication regulator SLD2
MEEQDREELIEKSNVLRVELKIWEKGFASANGGKKASRDDIKKNPEIGTLFPSTQSTNAVADNSQSGEIQRI